MPNRLIATAATCLLVLLPSWALAEPSVQQKRVQQAAKAVQECAEKSCDAKEMKEKFAALEAAREALDASLTEKADEEREAAKTSPDAPDASSSEEEDEDVDGVVTPPPPEPLPPRPTASWIAPPEFRLGAEPLPPPDTGEGGVRMRREHLGNYWMGLGLLTGGLIGLAASAGYIAENAEGATDFQDVAPGVVLGLINLCAVIAGGTLFADRGELVPDTSLRLEPTGRGLAIRF